MRPARVLALLLSSQLIACGGRRAAVVDPTAAESPRAGAMPKSEPPASPPATATAASAVAMPQFDSLLDILPQETQEFVIVTDVNHWLRLSETVKKPWQALSRKFWSRGPGSYEELFERWSAVEAVLASPELDAQRGLLLVKSGGKTFIVYSATEPEVLPRLLRERGIASADTSSACGPVAGQSRWVVCADDDATLAAFAPGGGGQDVRVLVGERFGRDAAKASMLVQFDRGKPSEGMLLLSAEGSDLRVALSMALPNEETDGLLGQGPAPVLAQAAPEGGFFWMRMGKEVLDEKARSADLMTQALIRSLTGEIYSGGLRGYEGFAFLVGLRTPDPMEGFLTLLGGQSSLLNTWLKDTVPLDLRLEKVVLGEVERSVVHGTLKLDRVQAKAYAKMGIAPDFWVLATEGYGGIVFGVSRERLESLVAASSVMKASRAPLGLPTAMVERLDANELSVAMHWALDGFQSPRTSQNLATLLSLSSAGSHVAGWTNTEVIDLAQVLLTPFSSISSWMVPAAGSRVRVDVHVLLWADPTTEEGQTVIASFSKPLSASGRAQVYRKLAQRYRESDRASTYRLRHIASESSWIVSSAVLGVFAGVLANGLKRYKERVLESYVSSSPEAREGHVE